jgi:hypothetical protein
MSKTANSILTVLAGVADALLLGFPSAAAVGMLVDDYNLSIAEANKLYNTVKSAIGQDTDRLQKLRDKRVSMDSFIQSYPELNLLAKHYAAKRGLLLEQENELEGKIRSNEAKLDATAEKIDDLSNRRNAVSAATVTKRWFETGDTK